MKQRKYKGKRILLLMFIFALLGRCLSSVQTEAKKKTEIVKVGSKYSLQLPASWHNHYIVKKGMDKQLGSYAAFYAKKCYQEKKEGWLFTIFRCKNDSYEELPDYEIIGMWGGVTYVVSYPTDVQDLGVTAQAKKQYSKLSSSLAKVVNTIQPQKAKKKKGYTVYFDYMIKIPKNWKNNYVVKKNKKKGYVTFYAKKCYKQKKEGMLFQIVRYSDDSYRELPSYTFVGKWKGKSYVAVYPTDVACAGSGKKAQKQYMKMEKKIKTVVSSFRPYKK